MLGGGSSASHRLKVGQTGAADRSLSSWISSGSREAEQQLLAQQQRRRPGWWPRWDAEEGRCFSLHETKKTKTCLLLSCFQPLKNKKHNIIFSDQNSGEFTGTFSRSDRQKQEIKLTDLWHGCWRLWPGIPECWSRWPGKAQSLWLWRWPIGRCRWGNTAPFHWPASSGPQLTAGSWSSGSRRWHFVPPGPPQTAGRGLWCSSEELDHKTPHQSYTEAIFSISLPTCSCTAGYCCFILTSFILTESQSKSTSWVSYLVSVWLRFEKQEQFNRHHINDGLFSSFML